MISRRTTTNGVAVLAIGGLIAFFWIDEAGRRSDRDARLRETVARLEARIPRGTIPHTPLLGDTVPGEATEGYSRAVALHENARPSDDDSSDTEVMCETATLHPRIDVVMERYRPALDALAAAAAADTVVVDRARTTTQEWTDIPRRPPFPFTSSLTKLAVVAIRHDLARGRTDSAVRRTADALTLQADVAANRFGMVELLAAAGIVVLCDAWTDDALRSSESDALRTLARVLDAFEARLPAIGESFAGELVLCWHVLDARRPGHRITASAVAALLHEVEVLTKTEGAVWSVRRAALEASSERSSNDPVIDLGAVEAARRTAIARLRMLRIACAHHLGERLELADPLGDGDLLIEARDTTTIVVRSASPDDEGQRIERTATRR